MKHFSLEQWVDHIRGLGSETARRAMRRHLDEGCSRCARRVGVLRRVLETAVADARLDTPAYAIKAVKAIFALDLPARRRAVLELLSLKPAFDSALAPAARGVRSSSATLRHVAFAGGDYLLDVSLEPQGGGRGSLVEGQLRHRSGRPLAHAAAYLYTDGRLEVSGFTDEQGDFELAMPQEPPTELLLMALDEGRCLVVDLDPASGSD